MEVERKYNCIFDLERECPVKTSYKLKPESLVEFCKICRQPELEKIKLEKAKMEFQYGLKKLELQRQQKVGIPDMLIPRGFRFSALLTFKCPKCGKPIKALTFTACEHALEEEILATSWGSREVEKV